MYLFDLQDVLGGAMQGRVGAEGGGSSLANLGHFSPQIRDFSHLHRATPVGIVISKLFLAIYFPNPQAGSRNSLIIKAQL